MGVRVRFATEFLENEPIPEEEGVDCYKKYKRIRSPFKLRRARGPAG